MGGLGQLLSQLTAVLPWWAWVLIAAPALFYGVPGYMYSVRTKQVKGLVRRMVRAEPATRHDLLHEAFARANDDVHLVALIVRETRRLTLPIQAQAAMSRLAALPESAPLISALDRAVARPATPSGDPFTELSTIQALLHEGLDSVAHTRLREARAAFPTHAGLADLADRLALDTTPRDV